MMGITQDYPPQNTPNSPLDSKPVSFPINWHSILKSDGPVLEMMGGQSTHQSTGHAAVSQGLVIYSNSFSWPKSKSLQMSRGNIPTWPARF